MKKEEELKLQILREASDLPEDKGLAYHNDRVANEIALELIYDGLVIGSESDYGNALITGIREAGARYLENQKPHRKVLAVGKKVLFVCYSFLLISIGYILNLDSVRSFFSELIGGLLK